MLQARKDLFDVRVLDEKKPYNVEELAKILSESDGVMSLLIDKINEEVLNKVEEMQKSCSGDKEDPKPKLKIIGQMAVGFEKQFFRQNYKKISKKSKKYEKNPKNCQKI